MTAAVLSSRQPSSPALRPVNPRRDMKAVADLIETVFANEMDPMGTRMVRDMRAYGRAGIFGYLLGRLLLPAAAYPKGYVWEEENDIIGNASLLRVEGFETRWVLANIAVRSEYRRRGIGRKLTQACIDFAQEQGAQELFLQVASSNQGAQVMYAALGFRPLVTRSIWRRGKSDVVLTSADTGQTRMRRDGEWTEQLTLAERLHPEGLVWPYPLTASLYKSSILDQLIGSIAQRHWVWVESGRMLASLAARYSADQNHWRLILVVEPEMRGQLERPMVSAALMALAGPRREMVLDYSPGLADQAFMDLGFKPERTQTWMSNDLGTKIKRE